MMTERRAPMESAPVLSALLHDLAPLPAQAERAVNGVTLDSRQVRPGYLFIACRGLRSRGHDFIADAVAKGAVAVVYEIAAGEPPSLPLFLGGVPQIPVVDLAQRAGLIAERFFGEPSRDLFMVGITGTNGKTSCSHYLAQCLHSEASPCGVIGTVGNGLVGMLRSGTHTTPDAVSLHAELAQLRESGARSVVMEASSHALDQGRVNAVAFDVALFTNLTRDHLDYHADMAAYGAAKQRLFHRPGLRYAVVNGDDAFGREILATLRPEVMGVSYGLEGAVAAAIPHVQARVLRLDAEGMQLSVRSPWGEGEVRVPLLGRFNASNVLAVLATLLIMDTGFAEALRRLARLQAVAGRMQCFGGGSAPRVVIDYAHTPDALEQALTALRAHCRGRLWCVFGCGGDRDRGKRPLMGAVASRLADRLVITDDNPRGEEPQAITADIMAGVDAAAEVQLIHERAAAIAYAVTQAGEGDVVLVAGKGHETYQQIGAQYLPYSDQAVALRLLSGGRP